jgi:NADH-quinone oxidoreductase subunit M
VILLGTFRVNWIAATLGTIGIVLAAWYMLVAVPKVMFGPFNTPNEQLKDMNAREIVIALALTVFFFVIGLYPNLLLDKINPATAELANLINSTLLIAGR